MLIQITRSLDARDAIRTDRLQPLEPCVGTGSYPPRRPHARSPSEPICGQCCLAWLAVEQPNGFDSTAETSPALHLRDCMSPRVRTGCALRMRVPEPLEHLCSVATPSRVSCAAYCAQKYPKSCLNRARPQGRASPACARSCPHPTALIGERAVDSSTDVLNRRTSVATP